MLKSMIKVGLRNLNRNRFHTILNIFGLAIGMTACILIFIYINQETGYDNYHRNSERIYRVHFHETSTNGTERRAISPTPLGPVLKKDFSEVEFLTRVGVAGKKLIESGESKFFESDLIFVDPDFFKVFTFDAVLGSTDDFGDDPNTVVISKSIATKYFGDSEPVGKIIRFDNKTDLKVTAVIGNVPRKSHFHFNFVMPFSLYAKDNQDKVTSWTWYSDLYTYVLLRENVDIDSFRNKIKPFIGKYSPDNAARKREVKIQPISSIHLNSDLSGEMEKNNSVSNIMIISTIALFVLLIACINFINLTTALSSSRMKEISIRRFLGAARSQIILQIITEAIMLTFITMVIALLCVEMSLPFFSELLSTDLLGIPITNSIFIVFFLVFPIIVGTLAGLYPAINISRRKTFVNLQNKELASHRGGRTGLVRKILVINQFAFSIILLISTFVISGQISFFNNSDLGFKDQNNIVIRLRDELLIEKSEVIKSAFRKNSSIKSATACFSTPISSYGISVSMYPQGLNGERMSFRFNMVDYNFVDHFGLKIIAGRNISKKYPTDTGQALILNETAVKQLGYKSPEAIIGRKILTGLDLEGKVVGVVKDFHISSLKRNIAPLALMHYPDLFNNIIVSTDKENLAGTISSLENTWNRFSPKFPFEHYFLSEFIDGLYSSDQQTLKVISTFSIIAIIVSCLGLFGLAVFTAQQKTKEIGIRKVLGATVNDIVILLNREFTKWIIISNVIAWPLAYYIMDKWLESFAYRMTIKLETFIISAILVFVIAILAVSSQALKAAMANPIKALRCE